MDLFDLLQAHGVTLPGYESSKADQQTYQKAMALIDAGCDINTTDSFGMTPLHIAVTHSLVFVAEQLIIRGADINAQDNLFQGTPLHHAIKFKNHEIVCMLLSYGTDVSIVNRDLMTPLMCAIDIDDIQTASTLIDYYADFSQTDKEGCDALLLATKIRSPIAINLIEAGAEVDCITDSEFNPFVFSLMHPKPTLFKLIWCKDHVKLLHLETPFLLLYIKCCAFETQEWLECLYIILTSPDAFEFMEQYNFYAAVSSNRHLSTVIRSLYTAFRKRNVSFDDRIAILSLCLSIGMTLEFDDIIHIYNMTRFGDELSIVIHTSDLLSRCDHQLQCNDVIVLHILGIEPVKQDILKAVIIDGFINEIQMLRRTHLIDDYSDCNIVNALQFLVLNDEDKDIIIKFMLKLDMPEFESTLELVKKAPNFPSLQELCRNCIRNLIRKPNEAPYKFHDKLKSLMLPNTLTDILIFKQPIYIL